MAVALSRRPGGGRSGWPVIRASESTRWRTKVSGSGHGKPGSEVRSVTAPCRATQTAVESATTSVLADAPASAQASMPRTSRANASAPNSRTGWPSGPSGTGAQ